MVVLQIQCEFIDSAASTNVLHQQGWEKLKGFDCFDCSLTKNAMLECLDAPNCPLCDSESQSSKAKYGLIFLYLSCEGGPPIAQISTYSVRPLHTRAVNTGRVWHYLNRDLCSKYSKSFLSQFVLLFPLREFIVFLKDKHVPFIFFVQIHKVRCIHLKYCICILYSKVQITDRADIYSAPNTVLTQKINISNLLDLM